MTNTAKILWTLAGVATAFGIYKYAQKAQKTSIAPLKKSVEDSDKRAEEASEIGGGHHHHGGGGGGRYPRGYVPYGYGFPYYYNPDALCTFKDKYGRAYVANCLTGAYNLDLPNT